MYHLDPLVTDVNSMPQWLRAIFENENDDRLIHRGDYIVAKTRDGAKIATGPCTITLTDDGHVDIV